MSQQFTTTYDDCGNVSVRSGWVLSRGMADLRLGPADGILTDPGQTGERSAEAPEGRIFLGGSGRNLVLSGFPDAVYDGVWRAGFPGVWNNGLLSLIKSSGGITTITDGTGVLAQLASGGPLGNLTSTAYGQALLGAAFTAVASAEWSAPGYGIPTSDMVSSAASLAKMKFNATDAAHYTSQEDPRFTIDIEEDGDANLRFSGVVIAVRNDGPSDNPAGEYDSTAAGLPWNPRPPPDSEDYVEPPATNPFGLLTIVYSWPAVPDLDTGTRFLGKQVGYGYFGSPYMSFSGDNTGPSGSETVVVNLAAAWAAGEITNSADVDCIADWYPKGSYGPASLAVSYSRPGFTPLAITIQPAQYSGGAKTIVASLRITADGSVGRYYEPWTASIIRRRIPPPTGVVYLAEVSVAEVYTSMEGPYFTATRPADTPQKYYIPLAISDGLGRVEAIRSGPILRR